MISERLSHVEYHSKPVKCICRAAPAVGSTLVNSVDDIQPYHWYVFPYLNED